MRVNLHDTEAVFTRIKKWTGLVPGFSRVFLHQQIQPRSVNSNSDSDAFKEEPKLGTVCRAKISSASRVNVGLDPEDPNVVLCRSHLMMKRMTYIVGHNLYNH